MGDRDRLKGTRYDDTLTIEGDNHAELVDGELRVGKRGDGSTISRAGNEVLVERSKGHNLSPCEKYGHKPNGAGDRCRFCGSAL